MVRRMDTKDIRAFMCLYEEQSISAAARKLYITPQGLSLSLKKMEKELNSQLFVRSNQGIVPTDTARYFYAHAGNIMEQLMQITNHIQKSEYQEKYHLNVAPTLGIIDYLTVRFFKQYKEDHPNIHLTVVENPDRTVKDRMLNGEAEVGFLAGPIDGTLFRAIPFSRHHHCLVIHKDHPLAQKESISYQDLDREAIALEGRDFMPYHNNINRFIKAGVAPDIVIETTEIDTTHKIADMNEGIGLSVDFPAWQDIRPNTVIRPFEDMECTWETYLVTRADQPVSREVAEFIRYAKWWLAVNKHVLFHWPEEYEYLNEWYNVEEKVDESQFFNH